MKKKKETGEFKTDEFPRPDTTPEGLPSSRALSLLPTVPRAPASTAATLPASMTAPPPFVLRVRRGLSRNTAGKADGQADRWGQGGVDPSIMASARSPPPATP